MRAADPYWMLVIQKNNNMCPHWFFYPVKTNPHSVDWTILIENNNPQDFTHPSFK